MGVVLLVLLGVHLQLELLLLLELLGIVLLLLLELILLLELCAVLLLKLVSRVGLWHCTAKLQVLLLLLLQFLCRRRRRGHRVSSTSWAEGRQLVATLLLRVVVALLQVIVVRVRWLSCGGGVGVFRNGVHHLCVLQMVQVV